MSYKPTIIDYSSKETFADERLLRECKLLKEAITNEVSDFMANLLDDYDNLRRIEEELVKRGLLEEPSQLPFFAVVEE